MTEEQTLVLDDVNPPPNTTAGDGTQFWHGLGLRTVVWWELVVLGGLLAGFVLIGLAAIAIASPLGHDEAVYSLRGLYYDGGEPDVGYWAAYRAPGLPFVFAIVGQVLGQGVGVNRAVVLGFALVVLVATWLITRRLFGRLEALVAVALLIMTGKFIFVATIVAVDPPGTAIALVAIAVFLYATVRATIPWHLFFTLPVITMAATYLRFGAANVVLAGLGTAVLLLLPTLWRRDRWRAVVRLAALSVVTGLGAALVLLVPQLTGSPIAPLIAQQRFGRNKGLTAWTGLVDAGNVILPSDDGLDIMRPLVFTMFVVGVVAAIAFARLGRLSVRSVVFGLGAGGATLGFIVVGVGLVVPQYLILVIPFFAMVGAAGLVHLGQLVCAGLPEVSPRTAALLPVALGLVVFILGVMSALDVVRQDHATLKQSFALLRTASIESGEALGEECILITSYSPQVGWYSGCETNTFGEFDAQSPYVALLGRRGRGVANEGETERFGVLYVENGKRQPAPEVMLQNHRVFVGDPVEFGDKGSGSLNYVRLDELNTCLLDRSC